MLSWLSIFNIQKTQGHVILYSEGVKKLKSNRDSKGIDEQQQLKANLKRWEGRPLLHIGLGGGEIAGPERQY